MAEHSPFASLDKRSFPNRFLLENALGKFSKRSNQNDGQDSVSEASQMAPKGDAFRASSKVLAPPGGVSSVCFGWGPRCVSAINGMECAWWSTKCAMLDRRRSTLYVAPRSRSTRLARLLALLSLMLSRMSAVVGRAANSRLSMGWWRCKVMVVRCGSWLSHCGRVRSVSVCTCGVVPSGTRRCRVGCVSGTWRGESTRACALRTW